MYQPNSLIVEVLTDIAGAGYSLSDCEKELLALAKKKNEVRLATHPKENTTAKGVVP